jgi:hypothetical protein
MTISSAALLAVYQRDSTLPYWLSNVDVDSLFSAYACCPERAHAWLRFRKVSDTCAGFADAVMMRGHFEGGVLASKTYHWTFTPGRVGELAVVIPVYNDYRLVDFVAMSRHDHNVWGACVGAGQYLGSLAVSPLRINRSLAGWLANDCEGVLPLSKGFYPQLRNATKLVAEDDDHAFELSELVFIEPALKFGCDAGQAEDQSFEQIEVAA